MALVVGVAGGAVEVLQDVSGDLGLGEVDVVGGDDGIVGVCHVVSGGRGAIGGWRGLKGSGLLRRKLQAIGSDYHVKEVWNVVSRRID